MCRLNDLRVVIFLLIAGMGGLFTGCILGPSDSVSDEFARISAQEVSNMDNNSSTMVGSAGAHSLGKRAEASADTVYYDWTVYPYSWDSTVSGYIRTATVTVSDGYARLRVDTLIFRDASGAGLRNPTFATCTSIDHTRNVKRTKGGNELDIRVVMHSTLTVAPGDTTHVKNGTISGTYDGDQVATGTITGVTRSYSGGHWQFPGSGTVSADFPRRTYLVQFLGNDSAKLTITNKSTNKTTIVMYQVDQQ